MSELSHQVRLSRLYQNVRQNEFIANVVVLFSGNALAQMITLATVPIITRIYSPEDFGVMALVNSVLSIFSVFVCLRYERAIMLPKSDREGEYLLQVCLLSTFVVTIFSVLVLLFGGNLLAELFKAGELQAWLWFVPVGVLFVGFRESFTYWFSRLKHFSDVSRSRVYLSLFSATSKIAVGYTIGASPFWLIFGNIFGLFGGSFPLIRKYGLRVNWLYFRGLTPKKIIYVVRKFRKFPIFSIWTGFVHEISQNIPVFFFSASFSPKVVGLYALSFNILNRPLDMISHSLTKVILQRFAALNANHERLENVFTKATLGLILLGIVPCGILYVWGASIFSVAFGQKWSAAGQYAAALTPWLFMAFIMTPATQVLTVRQKLGFNLGFHTIVGVSRVVSLGAAITYYNDPILSISIFAWINFVLYAFYIGYAYSLVKGNR